MINATRLKPVEKDSKGLSEGEDNDDASQPSSQPVVSLP